MNASVHADFYERVKATIYTTLPTVHYVEIDFSNGGKSETIRVFGLTNRQAGLIADGFNRAFPKPVAQAAE